MVCGPQGCDPSILGTNIIGRSTAGYDVRKRPLVYARTQGRPLNHVMSYQHPRTPGQQPSSPPGQPPMSGSVPVQRKLEGPDLGSFVIGGIMGLIFAYFVFTASGRRIGYAAGKRAARRIESGKRG